MQTLCVLVASPLPATKSRKDFCLQLRNADQSVLWQIAQLGPEFEQVLQQDRCRPGVSGSGRAIEFSEALIAALGRTGCDEVTGRKQHKQTHGMKGVLGFRGRTR